MSSKLESLKQEVRQSKEENNELKSKQQSLQVMLEGENKRCVEMKALFDEEKIIREELQKDLQISTQKTHETELRMSELNATKIKLDELNQVLLNDKEKLMEKID